MPFRYRRPDPSAVAAARERLQRLSGGSGEELAAPGPLSAARPALPAAQASAPSSSVAPVPAESGPAERLSTDPLPADLLPADLLPADLLPADLLPAAPAPGAPDSSSTWRRLRVVLAGWAERVVPAALRGVRLDPGWPGVAAVAVVAVLAAALAGFVVWRARPHAVPISAPPVTRAGTPATKGGGPTVVVAVAGGVRRPGLVTLPSGSRVADALRASGGVRPGVDVGLLNLARRLVDGEQIVVGAGAAPPPGSDAATGTLNLNTATVDQLDALPGVGPVLAARIAAYRSQHGGFRSVDQLREVSGIGEAKFTDLRPLVSV